MMTRDSISQRNYATGVCISNICSLFNLQVYIFGKNVEAQDDD